MLSKFPNKTLKVGAVVCLALESTFAFHPERISGNLSNPRWTKGIVRTEPDEIGWLNVAWVDDDGVKIGGNNYPGSGYDLIAEGEPGFEVLPFNRDNIIAMQRLIQLEPEF